MTDIRNRSSRDQLYRLQQNKALLPMTELQRATVSPKRTTYFWYEAAARVGRFTHFLTQFLWGNFSGANFQRWERPTLNLCASNVGFGFHTNWGQILHFLPRCMECRRGIAMRILSVCLSVRPSVTHVNCDKTVERSVQIFIPYERSFSLFFWEEEWLVGRPLLPEILSPPAPLGAKSPILNR